MLSALLTDRTFNKKGRSGSMSLRFPVGNSLLGALTCAPIQSSAYGWSSSIVISGLLSFASWATADEDPTLPQAYCWQTGWREYRVVLQE